MGYLVAGVAVLGVFYLLARFYTSLDPAAIVRAMRYGVGGLLVAVGVLLMAVGRWGVGSLIGAAGLSLVSFGKFGPFDFRSGQRRTSGTGSTVRTAWLEMRLDHDSGEMQGTVLNGTYAGAALDGLDEDAIRNLADEVAGDGDSVSLLEAYLDRRFPGGREDVKGDGAARPRGATNAGPMTDEEAYEILGLLPGAGEAEIRAAHRRLMKGFHPDQGGSTYLAAKINQAKDRLLGKHR